MYVRMYNYMPTIGQHTYNRVYIYNVYIYMVFLRVTLQEAARFDLSMPMKVKGKCGQTNDI